MTEAKRAALDAIRRNIAEQGHHTYLISGGPVPRFAYTIGVSQSLGAELICPGASFYSAAEVNGLINDVIDGLQSRTDWQALVVDSAHGSFSLRRAERSWVKRLMLGALDFYGVDDIPTFQIIPDAVHWTIDVPDLTLQFDAVAAPIWRWIETPWEYPVPSGSIVTTNLRALRGDRITEAARWEEDQWEFFSGPGPDVPMDEIRVVPLGTLLGSDESLEAVLALAPGRALWRDLDSDWQSWG